MNANEDAYGQQLLDQYKGQRPTAEIIERDDNYIETGSDEGQYFTEIEDWSEIEQIGIELAKGRVLDIGCGAGRHSLYLEEQGLDVTGIDNSPGAIEVCRMRGMEKALVKSIADVDDFEPDSFDTVIMFANNFGLFGSAENAKIILKKLAVITSPQAVILAESLDPYKTDNPDHMDYFEHNRQLGRLPGQIRFRIRYKKIIGEWFDYLFVSQDEMQEIFAGTDWRIETFIEDGSPNYIAVIVKKPM